MYHKLPHAGTLFFANLSPLVGAGQMGLHGLNSGGKKCFLKKWILQQVTI